MNYGFIKTACLSPHLKVADCCFNAENIIKEAKIASQKGASIIVFPELSITGYSCSDLFFQKTLLDSSQEQLVQIIKRTSFLNSLIFVGIPVSFTEGIYNCAAAFYKGKLLAVIPKSYLPNYNEFYEKRHFIPFNQTTKTQFIDFAGFENIPFGTNILIQDKNDQSLSIACEICEDLWVTNPPSVNHALNGATIIVNLSSGNEVIGKAEYRKNLVKSHSARCFCAYLYANAGCDESSQDMVFAGHNLICENGTLLAQSQLFSNQTIYADIDVERLCQERRKTTSFADSKNNFSSKDDYTTIKIDFIDYKNYEFSRYVDSHPFVPSNEQQRTNRCIEVMQLQSQGLAKRLRHINCKSAIVGLSGGLDSTLALLITCTAFDIVGIPREKITAITMPCFGTTDRTYNNACTLAKECGVQLKEINIKESVTQHFSDIEQDINQHDITYENAQARERTQILMDYANKTNGIVIGTGDLSELALGWCTYNGDHMSMYGVNSSIPKTLVRFLVQTYAEQNTDNINLSSVLKDILDTPVSPELLPPKDGNIAQVTEDLVGPYEIHDFYLYYLLRFGFSPSKIYFLAKQSELSKTYSNGILLKWLKVFYKRFFAQQFKRSCMPDGAKVGTISLSPRGDWRMPSDAQADLWLKEIENLK